MKILKKKLALIAFSLSALISCSNDDNNSKELEVVSSGFTMSLKTTGDGEPEYIVNKQDIMTGTISAVGQGIEQTGWRFYYPVGKTLFASGYSEDNQCAGYAAKSNGSITKVGEFIFENSLEVWGHTNDGEMLLGMEIPRTGFANKRLHFIDAKTAFVTKIVGTSIFQDQANNQVAWPTALQVRGDKLFIPYHVLDSKGNFTTPDPDKAYLAIYEFPNVGNTPTKIISDTRTSNIGVNGSTTGLIETDNGDLYSFSCGAIEAGFSVNSSKPSGILKIKAGETEFDTNYFFNVEAADNGGKIFWFDYVGGNKAIARLLTNSSGIAWDAFSRSTTAFNQKLVIIDLKAKTVTDVANVPLHAKRYSSPVLVEEGKAYVSIETASNAYVYQVDIDTATAVKGAKIEGKTIKGFYKL